MFSRINLFVTRGFADSVEHPIVPGVHHRIPQPISDRHISQRPPFAHRRARYLLAKVFRRDERDHPRGGGDGGRRQPGARKGTRSALDGIGDRGGRRGGARVPEDHARDAGFERRGERGDGLVPGALNGRVGGIGVAGDESPREHLLRNLGRGKVRARRPFLLRRDGRRVDDASEEPSYRIRRARGSILRPFDSIAGVFVVDGPSRSL